MLGDLEIRDAFRTYCKKKNTCILIDELDLNRGKARVDLIQFGQFIVGYEIKSDKDTLERLNTQTDNYNRSLEKIVLIIGSKHKEKVQELIPSWWGIILALPKNDGVSFISVRESELNPYFDPTSLLDLLWKEELLQILSIYGINSGVASKNKYELKQLVKSISPYYELKSYASAFVIQRKS
ncbi:putative phage-related protein [Bdellovibrio bacteriovorus W]|nr:putative phage-related protein [Bdellovibrio bacteriovorus W]